MDYVIVMESCFGEGEQIEVARCENPQVADAIAVVLSRHWHEDIASGVWFKVIPVGIPEEESLDPDGIPWSQNGGSWKNDGEYLFPNRRRT